MTDISTQPNYLKYEVANIYFQQAMNAPTAKLATLRFKGCLRKLAEIDSRFPASVLEPFRKEVLTAFAKHYRSQSLSCFSRGDFRAAIDFQRTALEIIEQNGDMVQRSEALCQLGNIHFFFAERFALTNLYKALKHYRCCYYAYCRSDKVLTIQEDLQYMLAQSNAMELIAKIQHQKEKKLQYVKSRSDVELRLDELIEQLPRVRQRWFCFFKNIGFVDQRFKLIAYELQELKFDKSAEKLASLRVMLEAFKLNVKHFVLKTYVMSVLAQINALETILKSPENSGFHRGYSRAFGS